MVRLTKSLRDMLETGRSVIARQDCKEMTANMDEDLSLRNFEMRRRWQLPTQSCLRSAIS